MQILPLSFSSLPPPCSLGCFRWTHLLMILLNMTVNNHFLGTHTHYTPTKLKDDLSCKYNIPEIPVMANPSKCHTVNGEVE